MADGTEPSYHLRMGDCPSPTFSTNSNRSSMYSTFSMNSLKGRFTYLAQILERKDSSTMSDEHAKRVGKGAIPFSQRVRMEQQKKERRSELAEKTYDLLLRPFRMAQQPFTSRKFIPSRQKRRSFFYTKHQKPSTLDFRCIGPGDDSSVLMMDELKKSSCFGIWGGVQKRHGGDLSYLLNDCAPRVDWRQPNVSFEWTSELSHC